MTPTAWANYWNTLGQGNLLFPPEAEEFARNLKAAVSFTPATRVLDFGCGYGHVAKLLAPSVGEIQFWDVAETMREAARNNLAEYPQAKPFQDSSAATFDCIVVNSVVQYMTCEELNTRLAQWKKRLSSQGCIVLADLIPRGHKVLADMVSLFGFSLKRGYLLRALRKTLAERKRYAQVAKQMPLYHVDLAQLQADATELGFATRILSRNLSHFKHRKTAILTHTSVKV